MLMFHQITVDTYKYATYGEINPALFQIVTFPYLFGVMYGDYGHGMIFFVMGFLMCAFNKQLQKNPDMKGLQATRYFWLMMGFFSVYNGLIYNEFFAVTNNWFGTCFDVKAYDEADPATRTVINYTNNDSDCVYHFGMDPSQALGTSYLTFTNNIKEKLSVVIAYIHLNFGIVLKGLNCIYFGKYKELCFDVIAGFFIFLGLIGYMVVLIYAKWWYPVYTYDDINPETFDTELSVSTAPSIITLVIGDIMGPLGFASKNEEVYFYYPAQ